MGYLVLGWCFVVIAYFLGGSILSGLYSVKAWIVCISTSVSITVSASISVSASFCLYRCPYLYRSCRGNHQGMTSSITKVNKSWKFEERQRDRMPKHRHNDIEEV